MFSFEVTPPEGVKFVRLDFDIWRGKAPSLRVTDKFPDGSINVEVSEKEADTIQDYWDDIGASYRML